MKIKSQKIQGLVFAASLASGMLLTGVAASAQTAPSPVPANTVSANSAAVFTSTVDVKAKRAAELEQENADARRVEFVLFGMSF